MATQNKTFWSADGTQLPEIESHTKVKHKVLEEYILQWVETLVGHGKFGVNKLTIVDGYSGGGLYRDGESYWEGSPLRIIRKFIEGLTNVLHRKPYLNPQYEFIFIDSKPEHINCLKLQIYSAGLGHHIEDGTCKIKCIKFEKELQDIIKQIKSKKGHSFFFLDPFNLAITPAITKEIFKLEKTEILLNHMAKGLYRILGDKGKKYKPFFDSFGYENTFQEKVKEASTINKYTAIRQEALNLFRVKGGASFIHTFAVIDKKTAPIYYLIHLSNSPVALAVMRDVTWGNNNILFRYQYGVHGFGRITEDEYGQNLTIINLEEENEQFCIDELSNQVGGHLQVNNKTNFNELYVQTLQTNPATKTHYIKAIIQLQEEKEIVVFRDGKIRSIKSIKPTDIIQKVEKQITIFSRSEFSVSTDKQRILYPKQKTKLSRKNQADSEQLWLI